MTDEFFVGLNSAWAVAKLALGAFFLVSYRYRRRDYEFLLVALLCFALAFYSTGIALGYAVKNIEAWMTMASFAHIGALAAAALNLHFVLRFTHVRTPRRALVALYAVTVLFQVAAAIGYWWHGQDFWHLDSSALGVASGHIVATPTLIADAACMLMLAELMCGLALLARAYVRGQREAAWALAGSVAVLLAAANDVFVTFGLLATAYIAPAAFVVYACMVAVVVPWRYRRSEGALQETKTDLVRTTARLGLSEETLEGVRQELHRKEQLATVGELAAAIAHEVRTPIAVIGTACANLRRPTTGPEDREAMVGIVEEESERLNRLVSDLLRLARPVKASRAPVPFEQLCARAVREARTSYGVAVSFPSPGALRLLGDPGLLPLVFQNLIENACQATGPNGRVEISAVVGRQGAREMARIAIRDEGHGMDADVLAQARDPFFTTRASGTGLGLALVQRIVEAHHGSLELSSTPGVGTTVVVHLPTAAAIPDSPPPAVAPLPSGHGGLVPA